MIPDLPGERWRPIAGYEDVYEISDRGRVKSLARTVEVTGRHPQRRRVPEQLRKGRLSRGGLYIVLWSDGVAVQLRIGRLVAEMFIGECPPGHQVMLVDGDPANVALGNIVYATRATIENNKIERGTAPTGEQARLSKLTDDEARFIRRNPDGLGKATLARRFGISETSVKAIITNKHWKHLSHGEAAGCVLPDPDPENAVVAPTTPSAPQGRTVETCARGHQPETVSS